MLAAGPAALEHRAQMLGLLASRIANFNELARSSDPELPPLPPAVFALYTGGLDELIRDRLRTASPEALRELVEPVLDATYALFGAATATPSSTPASSTGTTGVIPSDSILGASMNAA